MHPILPHPLSLKNFVALDSFADEIFANLNWFHAIIVKVFVSDKAKMRQNVNLHSAHLRRQCLGFHFRFSKRRATFSTCSQIVLQCGAVLRFHTTSFAKTGWVPPWVKAPPQHPLMAAFGAYLRGSRPG